MYIIRVYIYFLRSFPLFVEVVTLFVFMVYQYAIKGQHTMSMKIDI